MHKVRGTAVSILNNAIKYIKESDEWISERYKYWLKEEQRREEITRVSWHKWQNCLKSGHYDKEGHYVKPVCYHQEEQYNHARLALLDAKKQVEEIRKWQVKIQQAVSEYKVQHSKFKSTVETGLQDADSTLDKQIYALQGFCANGKDSENNTEGSKGIPGGDLSMAGQIHPVSGVSFDADGFPVFDSKYNAYLQPSSYTASDYRQFKDATEQLANEIQKNPSFGNMFSQDQLDDIRNGIKPEGYTWHHHQQTGKMQLVDSNLHRLTGHTGGRSIWGGGSGFR